MASSELVKGSTWSTVQAQLQKHVGTLAQALPAASGGRERQMARAHRCARVAMTALRLDRDKGGRLLQCQPASILGSVLQACQLGLELDGVMGQAYLVPYGTECQMQVGYRGLQALASRSGKVNLLPPQLVYGNEYFEVQAGTESKITHKPRLVDRGELIGVYAVAHYVGNSTPPAFRVLSLDDVHKRRDVSKAAKGRMSPWKDWYEEMVLKTAVRALCKHLPQAAEAQRAAVHDEYVEAGHAPPPPDLDDYAATAVVDAESEPIRDIGEEG